MAWSWEFGLFMLGVSLSNFYCAQQVARGKHKGWWMALTSAISMLPLLYYKYGNFFLRSVEDAAGIFGAELSFIELNVILPVGISFFTFQALSYSIDIYRKQMEPEPSVVKFLTFVAFFPQLVAGPIERLSNIIPQFDVVKQFNLEAFTAGGRLFIWGLFKKVVIADRLALYVDPVFNNPELYSGPTFVVATLLFTFQIYCDFSGYSDMAIGIARTFGFKLMQNFNLPYLSKSIGEFWKRWHISLSSWFGDYLYIPLGGNRVSVPRWMFNIVVVFLVSGLWHGANWTFIIWGALHGSYYLIEYIGTLFMKKAGIAHWRETSWFTLVKIPMVFVLVSFAWIFFRANSVSDAFYMINQMTSFSGNLWWGSSAFSTVIGLALIVLLVIVQILQYNKQLSLYYRVANLPQWVVGSAYILLLLGISLLGISSTAFIYFQF
jgi:D-alanyl-lipoteichoic acid acyltransferase DltB (MBOAT superfamily)